MVGTKCPGEVDQRLTQTDVANLSILYLIFWIVEEYLQVLLWWEEGKKREERGREVAKSLKPCSRWNLSISTDIPPKITAHRTATYCAFFLAEFGVVDEEADDPGLVQGHDANDRCSLRTSSLDAR